MKLVDGSYQALTKVKGLSPATEALGESTVFKNWKAERCCAKWRVRHCSPGYEAQEARQGWRFRPDILKQLKMIADQL